MNHPVRVRFAPSPTGPLHIGGVRTALFNYLFAKKHKGTFVLRIEDTDQSRYVEGAEKYIVEALNWCGIPFDEGIGKEGPYAPYRQSARKTLYKKYAQKLIDTGWAYYAFDTTDSLDFHRKDHEAKGKTFIYNHHNRLKLNNSLALKVDVVSEKIKNGTPYVIRFKTPTDEKLQLTDIIRGEMTIDTNVLDDKILFKSDGMPTYHLANIVDDHLMKISHVIRGEEWLPSLALHVLLYRAFGWEAPQFAHLPLILKPVGKGKLSKRDGDKMGFPVFPLNWTDPKTNEVSVGYKETGYFNDAVVNMLALLGWNAGTEQEIFSLDQLVSEFDLSRVSKAGAKFDPEKTKWFQHQYMQKQSDSDLADLFIPVLKEKLSVVLNRPEVGRTFVTKVISLTKERATFVSDFWDLTSFFFLAPTSFDAKAVKKQWQETTPELMQELIQVIREVSDFSSENLEQRIKKWITKKEFGFGRVMQPFRLCLVGALKGPHLFDIVAIIGKEETVSRLQFAIDSIKK
jgi:glutamyl-tRNA synthetase